MSAPGGYAASPEALADAATGIEDALVELRSIGSVGAAEAGRGVTGLALNPAAVGHAGFATALTGFCARWEWGVRALVQAGARIVDGLHGTATAYQKAENTAEGLLKRVVFDATGDPRADSTKGADASWEQLLAPPAYDVDPGSFAQAGDHIAATWRETADDAVANSVPGMAVRAAGGENPLQDQIDDLAGLSEIGS
jgi:hypothetical protein